MAKKEADFMGEKTTKRGRKPNAETVTKRKYTRRAKPASIVGEMTKIEMPVEMAAAYSMGYAAGQWVSRH